MTDGGDREPPRYRDSSSSSESEESFSADEQSESEEPVDEEVPPPQSLDYDGGDQSRYPAEEESKMDEEESTSM